MIEVSRYDKKNRDNFNRTGLLHLYWELFDCPKHKGSGFRFMEREPVLILDDILSQFQHYIPLIELGYCSKAYADLLGLPFISPYRVGKGIRLRVTNAQKRMFLVENLIIRGVRRIAVSDNYVEFDLDNYLQKPKLYIR